MFRKRIKKKYPPGTFIPTPARVMAILQLCLAFTVLFWAVSQPFLEELFAIKSSLGIYQHVMGSKRSPHLPRFAELDVSKQSQVQAQYEELRSELEQSFLSKLKRSIRIFFWGIPPYKQVWLALSILIPIFLLKKVEGSIHIVWLLPLLTLVYAVDNRWYGITPVDRTVEFYPSEEKVLGYLGGPLEADISMQREQLQKGWGLYLIAEWAREIPVHDEKLFAQQLAKGDFQFHLALLDLIYDEWKAGSKQHQVKQNLLVLAFYLLWNLSFAVVVSYVLPPSTVFSLRYCSPQRDKTAGSDSTPLTLTKR